MVGISRCANNISNPFSLQDEINTLDSIVNKLENPYIWSPSLNGIFLDNLDTEKDVFFSCFLTDPQFVLENPYEWNVSIFTPDKELIAQKLYSDVGTQIEGYIGEITPLLTEGNYILSITAYFINYESVSTSTDFYYPFSMIFNLDEQLTLTSNRYFEVPGDIYLSLYKAADDTLVGRIYGAYGSIPFSFTTSEDAWYDTGLGEDGTDSPNLVPDYYYATIGFSYEGKDYKY